MTLVELAQVVARAVWRPAEVIIASGLAHAPTLLLVGGPAGAEPIPLRGPGWRAASLAGPGRFEIVQFDGDWKDGAAALVQERVAAGAEAAILIAEAWGVTLPAESGDERLAAIDAIRQWTAAHGSLEGYPGREDILAVQAACADGRLYYHRAILRDGSRPRLGPVQQLPVEQASDRFFDALPWPGGRAPILN